MRNLFHIIKYRENKKIDVNEKKNLALRTTQDKSTNHRWSADYQLETIGLSFKRSYIHYDTQGNLFLKHTRKTIKRKSY